MTISSNFLVTILNLEILFNFSGHVLRFTQTKKTIYTTKFTWLEGHKIYVLNFNFREISPKGLGSRRGEIGPAIEMHTNLEYVYMVCFIEKNRNFSCLVLKLCKLGVFKDKTLCKFCAKSNVICIAM